MEIKSTQDITEALKSGKHLAVKFGASWCNPCKAFKSVFDKVTSKHADAVQACEFDIDDDDEGLCETFSIRSVPTTILFRADGKTERLVGTLGETEFEKWLTDNMK